MNNCCAPSTPPARPSTPTKRGSTKTKRAPAADLQELVNRLVRASSAEVAHSGDYAIDATLKWAYERPRTAAGRRGLNDKIDRRGKDGEAGPPLTLSAVIDADAESDLEEAGLLRDPLDERKMSR